MAPKAAFIKTIGTTELFQAICDEFHVSCFNVLTGFKYIGEKIHQWENQTDGYQYIFGGEESYGYLLGTFVRDKDAVVCSALIAEVALQSKMQGKTLLDKLNELYSKYGIYEEKTLGINFGETKEGKEQMAVGMDRLRKTVLQRIDNIPVVAIEDYLTSTKYYINTGKKEPLTLPVSNVLLFWLDDGSKVMIRPSGTEPKIKLSCGVCLKKIDTVESGIQQAQQRCDALLSSLKQDLMQTL